MHRAAIGKVAVTVFCAFSCGLWPEASFRQRDKASDADWPRIRISDPYTRDAATRALNGAYELLAAPTCQTIFSEFLDHRKLPLTERLRELVLTPKAYLRIVLFEDGQREAPCREHGVLAFTARASRVVYLCGRDFERAWRRNSRDAEITVIHEMLHSLGLGENPPTPRSITYQIQKRCGRRGGPTRSVASGLSRT